MIFQTLNVLMSVLFALAVAVQYNDPDPLKWILIYSAACAVSIITALRNATPAFLAVTVGAIATLWALSLAPGVPGLDVYEHMFDAWEMHSAAIEEAREASGLFLVALWMLAIATREKISRRPSTAPGASEAAR